MMTWREKRTETAIRELADAFYAYEEARGQAQLDRLRGVLSDRLPDLWVDVCDGTFTPDELIPAPGEPMPVVDNPAADPVMSLGEVAELNRSGSRYA